jgi:L-iditol 2-dehydrogenase
MKAAYLVAKRKFEICDIAEPKMENDRDVLLKVLASGVCGSDIHIYTEGKIGGIEAELPMIIGHECCADVEKVGNAVAKVKPGDRVAIEPAVSCGQCDQCLKGRQNLCENIRFLSLPGELEGCLREYMVMPETNVIPLPDELTPEDGVVLEPLSVCAHAVNLAGTKPGDSVAILGSGPIGLLTLQVANVSGAVLSFATDIVRERAEMAARLGATYSFNRNETDVVQEILEVTDGRGVDVVFECAGEQDTINQGLDILRPGGRFVLIGIPAGAPQYSFDTDILRRKELSIVFVRRQVHCLETAINLVKAGRVDVRTPVTHCFPLEKTNDAYELVSTYKDGVVKAIINL